MACFSTLTVAQYDLGANAYWMSWLMNCLLKSGDGRRIRGVARTRLTQHGLFVKAMGVIKRLKIEARISTKDEEDKLALFDIRSKHYIRALRPREADKKSRITKDFADHINRCLVALTEN